MPPRTLASLAHALTVASSRDAALHALGEALSEVDRYAHLALIGFDARRGMLLDRVLVAGSRTDTVTLETTLDHLPTRERLAVIAGGQFVDFGETGDEFARLFQLPALGEPGWLSARGLSYEGELSSILLLYESRKMFGSRTSERFLPAIALFELAYVRFREREAREDAVRTLEDVTQRVHGDYERRLALIEERVREASAVRPADDSARVVLLERELAQANEDARRALKRANAVEATIASAVEQLEKAHVELHRRSESLRQKTRTIYLIDRVLTLDASMDDPRQLAEGLVSLVCDDMHAQRASLMLRAPDGESLYLAAFRGSGGECRDCGLERCRRGSAGERAGAESRFSRDGCHFAGKRPGGRGCGPKQVRWLARPRQLRGNSRRQPDCRARRTARFSPVFQGHPSKPHRHV